MHITIYINNIETKFERLKARCDLSEFRKEYDQAFENKDDKVLLRKLRVLNEKLNKKIDSLEMDWSAS